MKTILLKLSACLIASLLALITLIPVFASNISNADYYAVIRTTNSATTAASSVASNISGLNSAQMIAAGFINSSANNCAIRSSTGADLNFMPGYSSSPWCVFFNTVGGSSVTNSVGYFKNVTGGAIKYFPGTNGMSVLDGMTEPSGNFTLTFTDTWIDTASGANKTLLNKSQAIECSVSSGASGSIYAKIPNAGYPVITSNSTGYRSAQGSGIGVTIPAGTAAGNLLIAVIDEYGAAVRTITTPSGWTQLFQTNGYNASLSSFGAWYKVASGTETTTNFTTSGLCGYTFHCFNIDAESYFGVPVVGVTAVGNSVNPDSPNVAPGFGAVTTMWMAITGNAGANIAAYPAGYTGTMTVLNSPANGSAVRSAELYSSAASENPGAFTIAPATNWGANTIALRGAKTVTATSITSGEHDLIISANTTYFGIWVDGTLKDSTALSGATVPNTAYNWQFGSGNTTLYIGSVDYKVGGVTVDTFSWRYGSTFIGSAHGIVATPSFRTTSSNSNVTSTLELFQPISEPTAPAFAVGAGPDLITDNISANATPYSVNGSSILNYPGRNLIQSVASSSGVPYQIPSTFIGAFVLLALSILCSAFLKDAGASSIFVKSVVNVVGYGVLVALHIFDWWMLIFFFIFEQSIWFAAKERRE